MANLRTNNLSGEQGQNAYRGSVQFNDDDYLQIADSADIEFGSNDYTVEFWAIFTKKTSSTDYEEIVNKGYPFQIYRYAHNDLIALAVDSNASSYDINATFGTASRGDWHHIAVSRSGNTTKAFLNGIQGLSSTSSTSIDDTGSAFTIGAYADSLGSYKFRGVISNVRVVIGTALYTADFTPPTEELTIVDGTAILCCQDSNDPTQEATGKTITGFGNLATAGYLETQPKVIPPYGVDAGNTFGGPIQQSSQGYMYFPTGRTEERGGSRGVCAGGSDPSGRDNDISFINIQSQGNALDFGDLSINSHNTAGFSSRTRAVFSFGYIDASPNVSNTLEFITMMTQGNATDFGDTSFTTYEGGAASNDTRGLIAGGYNASPVNNVTNIDFVTIASLGNGSDFGDLTLGRRGLQGCGSPTRSVFASGYQQPDTGTKTNVIDFVTIATAGNAQDFGDLTSQRWGTSACADSTRGVFSGGLTPSDLDVIDFITIATTGNATDFGDLTAAGGRGSSTSNSIRGVNFHGIGSYVNTIGFVIIQTTGNEVDFGDNTYSSHGQGSGSTAHGGLS